MKHIWVVESSACRKWRPAGGPSIPYSYFTKRFAKPMLDELAKRFPGLKWRVAKYVRGEK
jgi:hypothetical protein